jgi:hypothetical protein
MMEIDRKVKLGRKEKAILDFLAQFPQGIWKAEIIEKFSWASRYNSVMNKRLYNMQKKGLIEIKAEINPSSGRSKQKVYLKQ